MWFYTWVVARREGGLLTWAFFWSNSLKRWPRCTSTIEMLCCYSYSPSSGSTQDFESHPAPIHTWAIFPTTLSWVFHEVRASLLQAGFLLPEEEWTSGRLVWWFMHSLEYALKAWPYLGLAVFSWLGASLPWQDHWWMASSNLLTVVADTSQTYQSVELRLIVQCLNYWNDCHLAHPESFSQLACQSHPVALYVWFAQS